MLGSLTESTLHDFKEQSASITDSDCEVSDDDEEFAGINAQKYFEFEPKTFKQASINHYMKRFGIGQK